MREKESAAGKRPGAADQAELCGMLKRFCQKRGLEVHENANGVSGKMPNGTELFLYAVPRETAGPGPSVRIYGQTYRSDQRTVPRTVSRVSLATFSLAVLTLGVGCWITLVRLLASQSSSQDSSTGAKNRFAL